MPSSSSSRLDRARRRIRELGRLNAFISVSHEVGDGPVVAVKDLMDARGLPTTGGGRLAPLEVATQDGPVVARLRDADCVIVGKTNLHEWAYGATSHNVHYGDVRNPHDDRRVAGGSSGGSAVAVAAGMCDWAIGTDTGGSIRIPAALCGVVGIKPTLGRVDATGVLPLSPTLDTVGPLARDVTTAAEALGLLLGDGHGHGEGHGDGAAGRRPDDRTLADLRFATPRGWVTGLDRATERVWRALEPRLEPIPFIDLEPAIRAGLTVLAYEAWQVHGAAVEASPERFGADVRTRLEGGRAIARRRYRAARDELEQLRRSADAALRGYDALVLPATPCIAPSVRRRDVGARLTRFTRPFNATGQPAVVVPAPTRGLPVGIQLVGRTGEDEAVIGCASALERHWSMPGGSRA